jgi:SAM-dependent methyltransferase
MEAKVAVDEERPCPACGGKSFLPFAKERIDENKINKFTYASRKQPEFMCLRLVRCTECDLIYAPIIVTPDVLLSAYSGAAYDSGPEAKAAACSYAKALTPYVKKFVHKNGAVDVGAGSGPLLPWLREVGFNPVAGIEPSTAAIAAAPPSVLPLLRQGMFSRTIIADISPSLICSFMTLEHLTDPGGFVGEVYDLLEPGGMLAVVVHNWRARLNRLLGLRSPIIDIEHLQLFNPHSLRTMLTRAGFVSVELQGIVNSYPLGYWIRLTPLPQSLKSVIISILNRIGLLNTKISLGVGNMLAVGYKPIEDIQ